jgi:putative PIN family toxin of toxin-antitoxin system
LFDTNLYINLLLFRFEDGSAVGVALRAASEHVFDLLLPEDVVAELGAVVARRPYLKVRVSQVQVDDLLVRLRAFAIPVPIVDVEIPQVWRDPHDDYLLAAAVLHAAEFIVTRDKDLLVLGETAGVRIVDPVDFLTIVSAMQEESGTV